MSETPLKEFTYNTESAPGIVPVKKYDPLPLYNDKNPMLALVQDPIDPNNLPKDLIEVCNRLLATMNQYNGIGLAAPQCGIALRLFVMAGGIVCINPRILTASIETLREKEGCLSFPGLFLPVTRPRTIEVEFYNEFGVLKQQTFTGTTAKVFQHETDHLNGIVFTSKVGNLTLQMAKKKKKKLLKRTEREVFARELNRMFPNFNNKMKQDAPREVSVESNRVK
jgi:peptide deformylase